MKEYLPEILSIGLFVWTVLILCFGVYSARASERELVDLKKRMAAIGEEIAEWEQEIAELKRVAARVREGIAP